MKCLCQNEMKELTTVYDSKEDSGGIYYYCPQCGRIFYNGYECYWIEPKYLENKKDVCSCGKKLNRSKASDVCFGRYSTDVIAMWCEDCGVVECFMD